MENKTMKKLFNLILAISFLAVSFAVPVAADVGTSVTSETFGKMQVTKTEKTSKNVFIESFAEKQKIHKNAQASDTLRNKFKIESCIPEIKTGFREDQPSNRIRSPNVCKQTA